MGKQVNLYLKKQDVSKINAYLLRNGFVFIQDRNYEKPHLDYANSLTELLSTTGYFSLKNTWLEFSELQITGKTFYQLNEHRSEMAAFTCFEEKNNILRLRFYYGHNFFDQDASQNFKVLDFDKKIDRFFAWLRRNFEKIPDMPTFYKSPDLGLENYF